MEIICPHCKKTAHDTDFFCPACGKKLKDPLLSTKISKQLVIYLISVFLPPFGLIPAFKYLKGNSRRLKIIGLIAIVLTFVTIFITILFTMQVITEANKVISAQKIELQNLGY